MIKNTDAAYKADWADFSRWCRMKGAAPLGDGTAPCPDPELIGQYIADLAAPDDRSALATGPALAVSTIERRLSGLAWQYRQRGFTLDRKNRQIAAALAHVRHTHARPPAQKQTVQPDDIRAMVATLPFDLRGLRDRAILLVCHAAALKRSEIVSLDHGQNDTPDSGGWVTINENDAVLFLRGKTGVREVKIARRPSDQTCPVHALEHYLHYAKIDAGPLFRRTTRNNKNVLAARLSDKHVARLIKQTVLAAGLRSDLPENERLALFSGQSLRPPRR